MGKTTVEARGSGTRGSDATEVLHQALHQIEAGRKVAICHILEIQGSVPCRPGWKKLITDDETTFGNLGGGAFEAQVIADALQQLQGTSTGIRDRYYFTEKAKQGLATGMSCGGYAEVWIEVMCASPVLVVCGGGPVGQALAVHGSLCGFEVLVADDRAEFADPELHPNAQVVVVQSDYQNLKLDRFESRDLYVCVVSRAWDVDAAALRSVLEQERKNLRYLGLMGSRRKIAKVKEHLADLGPGVESIRAPIGLAIGGQTPAEIAVSIVAELIQVRYQPTDSEPQPSP